MSDVADSPLPERATTPGGDMDGSPSAAAPASPPRVDDEQGADAQTNGSDEPKDTASTSARDLEDNLFGDDDDDDEEEQVRARVRTNGNRAPAVDQDDEDDEEQGVRIQSRRARPRVSSESPSPEPNRAATSSPAPRPSPSPQRRIHSPSASPSSSPFRRSQDLDDEEKRQLEYKEDDDVQPDENIQVAHIALPQMPVRRTKEHWMARIPNFLRYVTQPFHPDTWDDEHEEQMLQDEGFTSGFSHDAGAVSLLRTSNTIRWRYTDRVDDDGAKIPESNARIVRWSDGTMSVQVGRELFDITQQTEAGKMTTSTGTSTPQPSQSQSMSQGPGPSTQAQSQQIRSMPMGASGSSSRPAQSLSYLVVPHRREAVMESEGPIAGSLAFTPADTRSETHLRIAKALRFQKTARVVATDAGEGARDPELEKARIEKELKDAEKRRIRERQRADRKSGKLDDDTFDFDSRRRGGRPAVSARKMASGPRNTDYWSDESEAASVEADANEERAGPGRGLRQTRGDAKRAAAGRYADEDDGFIVNDEDDEDEDDEGYSRKKSRSAYDDDAMQVDDEPDAMEIAEAKIEEQERARKKAAVGANAPVYSDDDADGEDDKARTAPAAEDVSSSIKKKRIIESDDEDE